MQNNFSEETFEIAKIYSLLANALLRCTVLMKSKKVHFGAKNFIQRSIVNKLTTVVNDLKGLFVGNDLELIKQDMISDEVALQNENVQNMFLCLPKGIRDEVETYIEQRYYIYRQK